MKLVKIQSYDNDIKFKGTRTLKNTVAQLAKNNRYSLTEPNQRYISNSIDELGKTAGKKTVQFLLNIARKLKYSTNIKLEDLPVTDWKSKLLNAAAAALAITPLINKTEFAGKIDKLRVQQNLNRVEKDILSLRENLLKAVDLKQIQAQTIGGAKDFQRNLDYFIISSETTLEHKKYVLKKLNYLMSKRYKINPQLADKKSIVAAELINDMAIQTPGHEIPNIKAVNQKQHGMCAAISIVRKKLAYEDKPNYIDSILSELDDSDGIEVYDRSFLGSGKKTVLSKIPVDFEDALSKGYRIIDASTTQWMQLAKQSGYSANSMSNYIPFDRENFDINTDSFYNAKFENPELSTIQSYYQALLKAESVINDYKASKLKTKTLEAENSQEYGKNIKTLGNITHTLKKIIYESGEKDLGKINFLINGLLGLEKKYSRTIEENNKYEYLSNEEDSAKKEKIKNYLLDNGIRPSALEDCETNRIYELIESYHSIEPLVCPENDPLSNRIRAQKLYEIAAGVRYQFQIGLENETTLNYMMKKEHIPNREENIINTAKMLINELESNSGNKELIINSLSQNAGKNLKTDKNAIILLNSIIDGVSHYTNKEINKIYKSIELNTKTDALIEYIDSISMDIAYNSKKQQISSIAGALGTENSSEKVLSALEDIKHGLIDKKYTFNEIFNKLGQSSQILLAQEMFNQFLQKITDDGGMEMMDRFITENNLDVNNLEESLNYALNKIKYDIESIRDNIDAYAEMLEITDNNGVIIYSPEPADIIMRKFECNGTVIPSKDLREIQAHLDKIQKERSSDEFNSRQGKLKNKLLNKFSKNEENTLNTIEKNLNQTSRYVSKQLSYVQQYIKSPLEELKRNIGVNMGFWWVGKEGESGLTKGQDIRILEYITGRPHYTTSNIAKAIEKIKFSPYSGISSSSVFHDKAGFHAQYIADVEPVSIVKGADGAEQEHTDYVLFQDNTWGASEHENTWTDSRGFVRTDYSDNRGGTLGYITNSKYRNGNLVSRILNEMVIEEEPENVENRQYKKIRKGDLTGFTSPQYTSICLDGQSPAAEDIANSIYTTIFTPTSKLIDKMKTFAENMSAEEIDIRLKKLKTAGSGWENINEALLKRILSPDNSNLIKTKDDYDKLRDNDILKVMLEKTALYRNYPIYDLQEQIIKINDVKALNRYRNVQKQRAKRDFEYSFGKNICITDYILDSLTDKDEKTIKDFLVRNNISLTDEEFQELFYKDFTIDDKKFDGSMKHTITDLAEGMAGNYAEKIQDEKVLSDFKAVLKQIFSDRAYFNKKDVKNPKISHIINFIDRVYNPEDDEELIKIYQKLQDMPIPEFRKTILPQLTKEDLNIKSSTGFDVLKRIQHYESIAKNELANTIYGEEICKDIQHSSSYREYTNNKLYRTVKTMTKYNFDLVYQEMQNDLYLLTYEKLFNKYKDANIQQYGAFPAYPKVNYMPASVIKSISDNSLNPIAENVEHIAVLNDMIKYFELSDAIKNFSKNIGNDDILTENQYESLNGLLNGVADLSYNDESQKDVADAVLNALNIESGAQFKDYKKYLKIITKNIDSLKKSIGKENLQNEIEATKRIIASESDILSKVYIRSRYQNKFSETLGKYKKSLIKLKKDEDGNYISDIYWQQLINELNEYGILNEPEEVLDRYLKSLANDSELKRYNYLIEILLKRALEFSKLCDIQSLLMKALDKGIETDVKSAFKNVQVRLADGTSVPMNSAEIISNIVHSLVIDDDEETAIFFLDKLGLNETYVKYTAENIDFDEIKNMIDEIAAQNVNYSKFINYFNQNYEDIKHQMAEGQNPIKLVNKLKMLLSSSAKDNNVDRKNAKLLLNGIDKFKEAVAFNLNIQPINILDTVMYEAFKDFEMAINSEIKSLGEYIESHETIIRLMNNILVSVDSEASAKREEANLKFNDIIEYNNKVMNDLQAGE